MQDCDENCASCKEKCEAYEPLYRVNVIVRGFVDSPLENEFDYIEDAEECMVKVISDLMGEGCDDWTVSVYDTFECQDVRFDCSNNYR
jgi:hypothetical protein